MMGIKYLDEISYIRNLTPKDINKLICFRGIIIRCSEIYPEMKKALFRCTNCKTEV
jgi:DNA replication licensing factor MCM4